MPGETPISSMFCTVLCLFALSQFFGMLRYTWSFDASPGNARSRFSRRGFLSTRDITGCQPPCDLQLEVPIFTARNSVACRCFVHYGVAHVRVGHKAQRKAELKCSIVNFSIMHSSLMICCECKRNWKAFSSSLDFVAEFCVVVMFLKMRVSVFVCSVFELSALRKVEWNVLYCFIVRYRMETYCKVSGLAFLYYRTTKDIQPFAQP